MTQPMIRIIDGNNVTDREMNDDEFATHEAQVAETKAKAKADKDRVKLKADTLAKLGLTADEVAALLS
jgi:hypothetical protein